jgi:hypothetical protein
MRIKYERIGSNDFVVQDINEYDIESTGNENAEDFLFDAEKNGASIKIDFDCCGREGLFPDDNALYAVWDSSDIRKFIFKLSECL